VVPLNYLKELIGALEAALGESLLAVYLTGSAAVGAYRDGASDLDVLVVVDGASPSGLQAVVETCAHAVLPCPATKLELVVYERSALGALAWSLNFDTGAATHHVGFDPKDESAHWFVIDMAFARRHGRALVGPPPDELLPEIPDEVV